MDDELLTERRDDGVAVLTLNRPASLNAMTMSLQQRLDDALSELEADEDVRCVLLTGTGERAFCAGYDVHEMAAWDADTLLLRLLEREAYVWRFASTALPTVVALNGITYGVGAILASAADVRWGCTATTFRFTAGAHGGANATWTLPRLVGDGLASEILLSARTVDADEALRIGLLSRIAETGALVGDASALAAQIAANPPAGTRAIKRLLREHAGRSVAERFTVENLMMRTELRPRPVAEVYADSDFTPKI